MKKYLFFFENELVKVENSWLFSDFCSNPIDFGCITMKTNGKSQPNEQNHTKKSECSKNFKFDELVVEEKYIFFHEIFFRS